MREREWKEDAAMWHPLVALERLKASNFDRFGVFDQTSYLERSELLPHIGPFAAVCLLFPGALTWLWLVLAGRALRREMLRRPDFIPKKTDPDSARSSLGNAPKVRSI